jgi:hypothetical protein
MHRSSGKHRERHDYRAWSNVSLMDALWRTNGTLRNTNSPACQWHDLAPNCWGQRFKWKHRITMHSPAFTEYRYWGFSRLGYTGISRHFKDLWTRQQLRCETTECIHFGVGPWDCCDKEVKKYAARQSTRGSSLCPLLAVKLMALGQW